MVQKKERRHNNMKITAEIMERVEGLNAEQLEKLLTFLKVLNDGGTEAEAFAAAEGINA